MSSTAGQKYKFMVYAPDKADSPRYSVREQHLADVAPKLQDGTVPFAGMFLTPESFEPGAEKKGAGSLMIVEAESLADVRKMMEADIYFKAGVWDPEKLVILPFLQAQAK